jgi:hypothetical protein
LGLSHNPGVDSRQHMSDEKVSVYFTILVLVYNFSIRKTCRNLKGWGWWRKASGERWRRRKIADSHRCWETSTHWGRNGSRERRGRWHIHRSRRRRHSVRETLWGRRHTVRLRWWRHLHRLGRRRGGRHLRWGRHIECLWRRRHRHSLWWRRHRHRLGRWWHRHCLRWRRHRHGLGRRRHRYSLRRWRHGHCLRWRRH